PVSSTRIAETRARAEQLPPTEIRESPAYLLIKERLRVLTAESSIEIVEYYQDRLEKSPEPYPYLRYGYGLALVRDGRAGEAVKIFHELRQENDSVIAFHSALGQALMASGQPTEGLIVFEDGLRLFPRNVPLTVRYAEALMRAQQYDRAHAVLLDLFNNVPPTAAQVRLIANAAGGAGENAALAQPDLQPFQRARFEARKAQIVPYLPKNHPEKPPEDTKDG
ncbi:MAG: hypothetical protein AMJ59_20645, partial [Gammaproteobacteria bacterium SG8_31]